MKFIDLQNYLEEIKIFSSNDLKILDDKYEKSKISKWKKLWYIKQIIKWYYVLEKLNIDNILTRQQEL